MLKEIILCYNFAKPALPTGAQISAWLDSTGIPARLSPVAEWIRSLDIPGRLAPIRAWFDRLTH